MSSQNPTRSGKPSRSFGDAKRERNSASERKLSSGECEGAAESPDPEAREKKQKEAYARLLCSAREVPREILKEKTGNSDDLELESIVASEGEKEVSLEIARYKKKRKAAAIDSLLQEELPAETPQFLRRQFEDFKYSLQPGSSLLVPRPVADPSIFIEATARSRGIQSFNKRNTKGSSRGKGVGRGAKARLSNTEAAAGTASEQGKFILLAVATPKAFFNEYMRLVIGGFFGFGGAERDSDTNAPSTSTEATEGMAANGPQNCENRDQKQKQRSRSEKDERRGPRSLRSNNKGTSRQAAAGSLNMIVSPLRTPLAFGNHSLVQIRKMESKINRALPQCDLPPRKTVRQNRSGGKPPHRRLKPKHSKKQASSIAFGRSTAPSTASGKIKRTKKSPKTSIRYYSPSSNPGRFYD